MPKRTYQLSWAERQFVIDTRRGGPMPYIPGVELARRFRVSPAYISLIRTGKRYLRPQIRSCWESPGPELISAFKNAKALLAASHTQRATAQTLFLPEYVVAQLYRGTLGAKVPWPNGHFGSFIAAYGRDAHLRRRFANGIKRTKRADKKESYSNAP